MNSVNASKTTFIIFFALNAINTQLFTAEKQRTLIQKVNIAAIATAVTITSVFSTPALAENRENEENIVWTILPEAFRRVEMCKRISCSSSIEDDANKIIKKCLDIDPSRTGIIETSIARFFSIPESIIENTATVWEIMVLEKNFDDFSLDKILNCQTNQK